MKFEYKLSFGIAVFLGIIAIIYFAWSGEWAGTVMLVFGGAAYAMLFGYLLIQTFRRHHIPRSEDKRDGTHEEGAGELGFFPAASIWPVAMGLGAVLIGVGFVYGAWYWSIGGILFMGSIVGFTVEAEVH